MTAFQLLVVPGVLIATLFTGVFYLLLRLTVNWVRMMKAEKAAAQIAPDLLKQQEQVIQDTIYELEVNRLSYTAFPAELKGRLLDAHEAWASSSRERKGITR